MNIRRVGLGPRMSQAVIHNDVVYLAGQVPVDKIGASIAEQTRNVCDRIDAVLADAGTDKRHILTATIFLADTKNFDEMNKVWDSWIPSDATPGRATIESRLMHPGFGIEICIIAALP